MQLRTITAEELKDKIEHGFNFTVVNVLAEEYYQDGHIKGSINAPLESLKLIAEDWDRSREIVVYCASEECPASRNAYEMLADMNFQKLLEYPGGMREWKEKGFPCEGACTKEY